jgi:hypothetical protein
MNSDVKKGINVLINKKNDIDYMIKQFRVSELKRIIMVEIGEVYNEKTDFLTFFNSLLKEQKEYLKSKYVIMKTDTKLNESYFLYCENGVYVFDKQYNSEFTEKILSVEGVKIEFIQ